MTGGSTRSVGARASAVRASAPTGGPGVSVGAGTSAWEKRGAGLLCGERVSAGWAACERGFGPGKRLCWAKRAEGKGKAGRAVAGSFGPGFGFWLVFLF